MCSLLCLLASFTVGSGPTNMENHTIQELPCSFQCKFLPLPLNFSHQSLTHCSHEYLAIPSCVIVHSNCSPALWSYDLHTLHSLTCLLSLSLTHSISLTIQTVNPHTNIPAHILHCRFYVPFWITCIVLMCMLATAYVFVRKNVSRPLLFKRKVKNQTIYITITFSLLQRHRYKGQYSTNNEIQMVLNIYSQSMNNTVMYDCVCAPPPRQKLWEEEIRPLMVFPLIYIAILISPSVNRYSIYESAESTLRSVYYRSQPPE